MFYLLRNPEASLEQTKERLNLLDEHGVEALNILYPGLNYGGRLYYQFLESLPKEIEQLEKRIKELENKEIIKTRQLSNVITNSALIQRGLRHFFIELILNKRDILDEPET